RWPVPQGDLLISHLPAVLARIRELQDAAVRLPLSSVSLKTPVPNPSKIVNAPINYGSHIDESKSDQGIAHGRNITHISDWGLFLKANSALIGTGEEIALRFPDRRNDHEIELAVVIGKTCN